MERSVNTLLERLVATSFTKAYIYSRLEQDDDKVELDCERACIGSSEGMATETLIVDIFSGSCGLHNYLATKKIADIVYPHLAHLIEQALVDTGINHKILGTHILQPNEEEDWTTDLQRIFATVLINLPSLMEQAASAASNSSDIEEYPSIKRFATSA